MLDAPPADIEAPSPALGPRALVPKPCRGLPATAHALEAVDDLVPDGLDHLAAQISQSPTSATVSSIMNDKVVALPTSMTLEEATQLMLSQRISGAPVTDDSGKPVGIVSKTDLLEAWHEHERFVKNEASEGRDRPAQSGVVVGDIMVPYLLAAPHSCSIALAAALMAFEGVHRLLVLDDSNNMVGIVTSLDVLRWLAQLSGFCLPNSVTPQPA